jgi:hypothetical protein
MAAIRSMISRMMRMPIPENKELTISPIWFPPIWKMLYSLAHAGVSPIDNYTASWANTQLGDRRVWALAGLLKGSY